MAKTEKRKAADRAKTIDDIIKAHRSTELYMELDFCLNGDFD